MAARPTEVTAPGLPNAGRSVRNRTDSTRRAAVGHPSATRRAARVVGAVIASGLLLAACAGGPAARVSPSSGGSESASAAAPSSAMPTTSPLSAPPAAPTPAPPTFASTVTGITPDLADRVTSVSWHPGCPVPLADLRYVTVSHRTFDGGVATGELIVHAEVADGVVAVFHTLFDEGYPIRSMRLVDDFAGDDDASMAADNTSAFNCRLIAGTRVWSEHSYGRAIDVNPVENPWVRGAAVAPPAGVGFVERKAAPGVILPDDVVVRAFAAAGWKWGGYWTAGTLDYQHFSPSGR